MHQWGDWPDEMFDQVNDAAGFIGDWLRKWARLGVRDTKEKFGTVRVYCSFGWSCLYSAYRPGYCWIPSWWPYKLDLWFSYTFRLIDLVNRVVIPIQKKLYRLRYKQAIQKWPAIREEILEGSDWPEELRGL